MKQPDTAALRERLANYTPEEEFKQKTKELEWLLQEVNFQIIEVRNLLKEIQALKEELHGIHGSLKHTIQREQAASKALLAAKDSADNIVDGISNAIVKAERNTVIHAKVDDSELKKVNQCSAKHIEAEKKLLDEHCNKITKHLQDNEGVWLSNGWLRFTTIVLTICFLVVILWIHLKTKILH